MSVLIQDSKIVQRTSVWPLVGEKLGIDDQVFADVIACVVSVPNSVALFRGTFDRHQRCIHKQG